MSFFDFSSRSCDSIKICLMFDFFGFLGFIPIWIKQSTDFYPLVRVWEREREKNQSCGSKVPGVAGNTSHITLSIKKWLVANICRLNHASISIDQRRASSLNTLDDTTKVASEATKVGVEYINK